MRNLQAWPDRAQSLLVAQKLTRESLISNQTSSHLFSVDPTWLESFQTPPLGSIHSLWLGYNRPFNPQ